MAGRSWVVLASLKACQWYQTMKILGIWGQKKDFENCKHGTVVSSELALLEVSKGPVTVQGGWQMKQYAKHSEIMSEERASLRS